MLNRGLWRTEERARLGILVEALINVAMNDYKWCRWNCYLNFIRSKVVYGIKNTFFFKWQFPVAVVIIVVHIITSVMHGEKIHEAKAVGALLVFLEMLEQDRDPADL